MPKSKTLERLADVFAPVMKKEDTLRVFADLLTGPEREDLLLRLRIVEALLGGATQREVAKKLGVSIAKVTRGAEALRQSKGGFSLFFNSPKT